MSQWARSHPGEMREIAALPPSAWNAALQDAQRGLPLTPLERVNELDREIQELQRQDAEDRAR